MTPRIAVIAPDDIEWIRGAAGPLIVGEDVASASVIVTTADRASGLLVVPPAAPVVVIGEPVDVTCRHIALVIRRGLPSEHLGALLLSLAGQHAVPPPPRPPDTLSAARNAQRAFQASRRLAGSTDLVEAESTVIAAVLELTSADRAHCLFHDSDDGSLWSEALMRATGDDRRAVAGLAGYAATTGLMAIADRAGRDPRWAAAIDDPTGTAEDRLLAHPVAEPGGSVQAVLVAVRGGGRPAFSDAEADLLSRYAALAAPFVGQLSGQREAQAILSEAARHDGLFRAEAVAAQDQARWGDVIRVTPPWMGWSYWLLVALLAGAICYVAFGTIATYSTGPAVIRATSRREVVARTAGNVARVERAAGDKVAPRDIIARLDDEDQRAALERASRAFDSQLRNHMLDPSDSAADSALRQLRQARDAARAALEERVLRAPAGGTIGDVRVHSGQHVQPGDSVATVVEGDGQLEVIAFLPGEHRPQLAAGMAVRLEPRGYRHTYQSFVIDGVSSAVIGPSEARRVLGPDIADSFALGGSVVLVRGRLPRDVFDADGRTFRYHDGMLATAEVRVRVERILVALIPGLKAL